MPKMPPRPCTQPRCKAYAVKGGKCEEHKVAHTWNHTKTSKERGYGWSWVKLRKKILRRDKHLCQECKRNGRLTAGNQVDHIKPKSLGGGDDVDNLQVLCADCHSRKSAREGQRASTQQ